MARVPVRNGEGLGLGAGLEFSIPMIGSFDTSLKYQMLNIVGQESREESISQIAANISFMFSVL